MNVTLTVTPLGETIGAEVTGVAPEQLASDDRLAARDPRGARGATACSCSAACTSIPRRRWRSPSDSVTSTSPGPTTTRCPASTGSRSTRRRTPRPTTCTPPSIGTSTGAPRGRRVSPEGHGAHRHRRERRGRRDRVRQHLRRLRRPRRSREGKGRLAAGGVLPRGLPAEGAPRTDRRAARPCGGDARPRCSRWSGPITTGSAPSCIGASADHIVGLDPERAATCSTTCWCGPPGPNGSTATRGRSATR